MLGLENRVAWLESFVRRVQLASPDERDKLLRTVELGGHSSGRASEAVASAVRSAESAVLQLPHPGVDPGERYMTYNRSSSIFSFYQHGLPRAALSAEVISRFGSALPQPLST